MVHIKFRHMKMWKVYYGNFTHRKGVIPNFTFSVWNSRERKTTVFPSFVGSVVVPTSQFGRKNSFFFPSFSPIFPFLSCILVSSGYLIMFFPQVFNIKRRNLFCSHLSTQNLTWENTIFSSLSHPLSSPSLSLPQVPNTGIIFQNDKTRAHWKDLSCIFPSV